MMSHRTARYRAAQHTAHGAAMHSARHGTRHGTTQKPEPHFTLGLLCLHLCDSCGGVWVSSPFYSPPLDSIAFRTCSMASSNVAMPKTWAPSRCTICKMANSNQYCFASLHSLAALLGLLRDVLAWSSDEVHKRGVGSVALEA